MSKAIPVGRHKRTATPKIEIPGGSQKIADLLATPGVAEIELEIPRFEDRARPAGIHALRDDEFSLSAEHPEA